LVGSSVLTDELFKVLDASSQPLPAPAAEANRRPRKWTEAEDIRLMKGILLYGENNWLKVAEFVGGGRDRAKCAEHWRRGIDPRISQEAWTAAEDQQLCDLLTANPHMKWPDVAKQLKGRTDAQCRYEFEHIFHQDDRLKALAWRVSRRKD
jgi:hypothetical protein